MTELSLRLAVSLAQIAAVMGIVMLTVMILTLAERKVLGWMQDRMGPMEVGPYGILQPIADGLKLFFKEDIVPAGANKAMFTLAPILAMVPAMIGFAVIPFGPSVTLDAFGITIKPFVISDINIGILYILAFASIGAYGIILGGWSSNSKYSLLGGLRSAAQVISYELNVGLAIVGVLLLAGSLSLVTITEAQAGGFWHWYLGTSPFPAYPNFRLCRLRHFCRGRDQSRPVRPAGSRKRTRGWILHGIQRHALRLLLHRGIRQHGARVLRRRRAVLRRLERPLSRHHPRRISACEPFAWVENVAWFTVKLYLFLFLFFWLRATLPRLRYDQLMRFGWKVMLPDRVGQHRRDGHHRVLSTNQY